MKAIKSACKQVVGIYETAQFRGNRNQSFGSVVRMKSSLDTERCLVKCLNICGIIRVGKSQSVNQ